MKRVLVSILLWIVITLPITFLALLLDAYVVTHLRYLTTAFVEALSMTTYINRPLIIEIAERLPEVAGMAAGMLIILISVWVARSERAANKA